MGTHEAIVLTYVLTHKLTSCVPLASCCRKSCASRFSRCSTSSRGASIATW